jgi:hypothetical protein
MEPTDALNDHDDALVDLATAMAPPDRTLVGRSGRPPFLIV